MHLETFKPLELFEPMEHLELLKQFYTQDTYSGFQIDIRDLVEHISDKVRR